MTKILFYCAAIFCLQSHAQNLVVNPSFEDTVLCPDFVSEIDYASGWHTSVNTPDYYHVCNNTSAVNPGMVGVPNSARGYQPARTGDAFAGVVIYWTQQTDYREIFYGQLNAPLIAGQKYNVGMYTVMNEDNAQWAIDGGLGILLSSSPINPINPFIYSPQIVNPSGNVLNDTLNWTAISGTYVASGGEQYISIGSFIRDSALTIINRGGSYPFTSYAIDDVWVVAESEPTSAEAQLSIIKNEINVFPNPVQTMLTVSFQLEGSQGLHLVIRNMMGQPIYEMREASLSGSFRESIDLTYLPKGIYLLYIMAGEKRTFRKIVKD